MGISDRVANAVANRIKEIYPAVPVLINEQLRDKSPDKVFNISVESETCSQEAVRRHRTVLNLEIVYLVKTVTPGLTGALNNVFSALAPELQTVTHAGDSFRLRNIAKGIEDNVLHIFAQAEVRVEVTNAR